MIIVALIYCAPWSKPKQGVVTGILYTIEDSSVLIDNQIHKKGDIINGVKIVKIDRREITFRKGNQTWQQRVGQTPPSAWTTTDESAAANQNNKHAKKHAKFP